MQNNIRTVLGSRRCAAPPATIHSPFKDYRTAPIGTGQERFSESSAAALAEPHFAEEAKKRQRLSEGRGKKGLPSLENLNPVHATEQTAKAFGVSHGYVSQAKKLKAEQLEVFEQVHSGYKALP